MPKPPPAPSHSAGLAQASLTSILSPTSISSLTTSSNYTPAVASPSIAAFQIAQAGQQQQQQRQQQGALNKSDAIIVQMKQAGGISQGGPPGADSTVRGPLPPPIVSIPLPRE